jgi:hypothetical protein
LPTADDRGPPRRGRALSFPLLLAAALLAALPACVSPAAREASAAAPGLEVRLRPVEAPPGVAASGGRIGRLELLAAYRLESPSAAFGGLSAVRLVGRDLLLLSDRGRLFRAERVEDAATGRLVGLRGWSEQRLPRRLREADTEALAVLPDGRLVVGAEDLDELVRLRPDGRADGALPLPAHLHGHPVNEGVETLAALPDGGLLAVTEGLDAGPDLVAAARLPGGGRLAVGAPDGFRPTDAAVAGDALLLLQRRASLLGGLEARLVAVPLEGALLDGAAPLDGEELARFGADALGENFEGVTAREAGPGRYLVYLVADDNFSPLQRSLLLQLAWTP